MAVEEAELATDRRRGPAWGGVRIHDLAPDTLAQLEAVLPARRPRPVPRIATIGGGVTNLPVDLLSRISPDAVGNEPVAPAEADVLIVCPQEEGEEHLGPELSALERACSDAVAAARTGQTILMTSASYVGCTRDLLVVPLERRGFLVGEDIHVAVSPEGTSSTLSGRSQPRIVGAATPSCANVAAAILDGVGPVVVAKSLEAAETASLSAPSRQRIGRAFKRALDIVGALALLVVLSPTIALVALAVVADSGRPILFTQERVGLNGHRFRFIKFRTMTNDAEGRLNEVLHLNGIRGPAFQIENDPRVTRIGRFLRASSLDELPQFWNVLRGDMSLVGPRPAPLVEVAAYKPWHLRRLAAKPGITGLAQVRARKYLEFDVKAGLDLQYIDHWSPRLDVEILLRTLPAVFRFTGR